MDGLSAAGSIIAVLDMTIKVGSQCTEYYRGVKAARGDITRLQGVIQTLKGLFDKCKNMLDQESRLGCSKELQVALDECYSSLKSLEDRLEPNSSRKVMSRFGIRALKWPFDRKEVDKIIESLKHHSDSISLAMQIDQTMLIARIDRHLDLSKLLIAEGAAFDSHMDEHDPQCHPDTRTDLIRDVKAWAHSPTSKAIFWLNGMAGTGKSTISRTIAQVFAHHGELGASFFFKRGEGDRGRATRFFTTIASQVVYSIPGLAPIVVKALAEDPDISRKWIKHQFDKLILAPIMSLPISSKAKVQTHVIVIDALDECDRDDDIKAILQLLAQTHEIKSIRLRIFVTSRPELPIRLGFKKISGDLHHDLILHELPKAIIDHDIFAFLKDELSRIQGENALPSDWPRHEKIQALVEIASPLFIFAATACRFLEDQRLGGDVQNKLEMIVKYQSLKDASQLDKTYLPVLERLEAGLTETGKRQLSERFKLIVGTIVLLNEPLTINGLANLLAIPKEDLIGLLNLLHSVLDVPHDPGLPIRLLHLSFRDFLIDPTKKERTLFAVHEETAHEAIALMCLERLMGNQGLGKNICNLDSYGKMLVDVPEQTIESCISVELNYACRYWADHIEKSRNGSRFTDLTFQFLQKHLLHWLEVMALIGRMTEALVTVQSLRSILNCIPEEPCYEFIHDADRFVLKYHNIIRKAPLQSYASGLIFAPKGSFIRWQFEHEVPNWLAQLPDTDETWNASIQTLELNNSVNSSKNVAFSPDGMLLAASSFRTLTLWDVRSGEERQTLAHDSEIECIAWSPDGTSLALGDWNGNLSIWNMRLGEKMLTVRGHASGVSALAFSVDGILAMVGEGDATIRIWDPISGVFEEVVPVHGFLPKQLAFSADGEVLSVTSHHPRLHDSDIVPLKQYVTRFGEGKKLQEFSMACSFARSKSSLLVAFFRDGGELTIRDVSSGKTLQTLKGQKESLDQMALSSNESLLATVSRYSTTIRLWSMHTGELQQEYRENLIVSSIDFCPGNLVLAAGFAGGSIELWDCSVSPPAQHRNQERLKQTFSTLDMSTLVSLSHSSTIRVGNLQLAGEEPVFQSIIPDSVVERAVCTPDGSLMALIGSSDDFGFSHNIELWNMETMRLQCTIKLTGDHSDNPMTGSLNKTVLALGRYCQSNIEIFDVGSGQLIQVLEHGTNDLQLSIELSPNGSIVSASQKEMKYWSLQPQADKSTLGQKYSIRWAVGIEKRIWEVTLSPDGAILASFTANNIKLRSTRCGGTLHTLNGGPVASISFSPDSSLLCSSAAGRLEANDSIIRLWDTSSGQQLHSIKLVINIHHLSLTTDRLFSNGAIFDRVFEPGKYLSMRPGLLVKGQWISRSTGEDLLWLPPEYRNVWLCHDGKTVFVVLKTGEFMKLEFSV